MLEAGIDRVVLKDLEIKRVDTELLEKQGFTVIRDKNAIRILKTAEGQDECISYIRVSKKQDERLLINDLKIGRARLNESLNGYVDYEHLNVNLPKGISATKTNEKNISNTKDLVKAIQIVQNELEALGFGRVDLLNAELKEIEINVNLELSRCFKEYERVLNYLQGLLPNRLKGKNAYHKPKNAFTGFQVGNGSINLKMYDKRANILKNEGQDIGKELLRIEYTLLHERKIKDVFGTNRLNEVVANEFKLVDEAFKKLIQGDLIERVYKDIERQFKQTKKAIKEYRGKGVKSAGMEYIFDTDIFDIEIMLGALKDDKRRGNYARECKNLMNRCLEGEQKKLFGNIEKLNEILVQLGQKKIKIEMTKHIEKEVKKYSSLQDDL